MEYLQPFNYGNAIAQGANIQNAQTQNALNQQQLDPNSLQNQLRQQQLAEAKQTVNSGDVQQQFQNTRLLNAYMAQIAQDPSSAQTLIPDLKQKGIIKQDFQIDGLSPDQIKENATKAYNATHAALMSYQMTNPKDNIPNDFKTALLYHSADPSLRQDFDITKRSPIVLNQGGSNVVALPDQLFGNPYGNPVKRPNQGQPVPGNALSGNQITGNQITGNQITSGNALSSRGMVVMPKTLTPGEQPAIKGAQTQATKEAELRTTNKEQAMIDLPQKKIDLEYGLQQIDAILAHPGLDAAIGPIASRTITLRPQTADFEARRNTLNSTVFIDVRQMLKGGGAITDFEGSKAEAARIRAQESQSPEAFREAMNEYKYWATRGFQKLQQTAGVPSDELINLAPPPKGLQKIQEQLYNKSGGKMGSQPKPVIKPETQNSISDDELLKSYGIK